MTVAQLALGGRGSSRAGARENRASSEQPPAVGSHARFVYLAGQHSNRCDLQAAQMRAYPPGGRLQGSCCSAMDEASYRRQVAALRQYAAIPQIPGDPYDIPVALARQLLSYDASIRLNPGERDTYQRAMRMSPEHGPCCCRCWRWNAFRGLSKYLIHERRWLAARLGRLIGMLDGCGGPDHDNRAGSTVPGMS